MFLRKFGNEHAVGGMEAKTNLVAELAAHGVSIQLPVFTRSSPKSWFTIIEANFHVRGVSTPDTKYWHAVSKLDADTLEEIQEFLATDRGKDPYQELKEHLCEVFEPTQQQKLDQFLSTTVMGEKRPSAFLRELERMVAGIPVSQIVRRVFTRSLLPRIATAIAGNTNSTIKEIGKAADQAWDEVSGKPVTITQTVAAISRDSGRGKGGRQRGGPRRSGSRPPANQSQQRLCYFHERWGDDAKRCISTCSRWASRGNVQPTKVFHVEQEDEMSENSEN